jgi:hypothetical protein
MIIQAFSFENFDLIHRPDEISKKRFHWTGRAAECSESIYFRLAFLCDLFDSSEAGGETMSKH